MTHTPQMAVCPSCGAPLISTMVFPKFEFYCLECGGKFGLMTPEAAKETPALRARYEALRTEWREHAPAIISPCSWKTDCEACAPHRRDNPHAAHATDEEIAAHEAAMAWLAERVRS